jgi:D-alanyl-D-alanine carboxypeptidase/D-alanyl-D-alanine-endopeptidase (penicillin-binding protein 4)
MRRRWWFSVCSAALYLVAFFLAPVAIEADESVEPAALMGTPPPAGSVQPQQNAEAEALARLKPVVAIATSWLQKPELRRSYVGVEVMDIPTGRVLFSHNGDHRFISASIAKIFTTACAFDTLGGGYKYSTAISGFGELRNNGKLEGSLGIVSSQDPSFSYQDLRDLVECVKGKVKTVTGDVFVAAVPGGGDHFSTEWLVQDWGQDWMPCSSDLVVDRNVVPARDPGRGYSFSMVGADDARSALIRSLLNSPWAPAWIEFDKSSNSVVYFRPSQTVAGGFTVGNPNEFNAAVAKLMLKSIGVKVEGKSSHGEQTATLLCEHQSKPLSEIIRFTLKESDNLYAQQLLRTLGLQVPAAKGLGTNSLEERGLVRLNRWLESVGVPSGDAIVFDGCGLSRKNAIAPHAFNVVLQHMAGPDGNGPYVDLLIHDGDDEHHSFRYKTGAMDSVRALSGVVKTSTGRPLAVTAIVNDHLPSVRELRASLSGLIKQIEYLGDLKLAPQAKPKPLHQTSAATKVPHKRRRRSK